MKTNFLDNAVSESRQKNSLDSKKKIKKEIKKVPIKYRLISKILEAILEEKKVPPSVTITILFLAISQVVGLVTIVNKTVSLILNNF